MPLLAKQRKSIADIKAPGPGAFASRDTKDFKPAISSPFASKPNIEKATFQVISDLHLEREGADAYSTYAKKIPVKADFLIIAGDIGEVHTPNEGWFYFIEELYLKDPGWKRVSMLCPFPREHEEA